MSGPLLIAGLLALLAGLLLVSVARISRHRSGLPDGPVRYTDTGDERPPVLFSPQLGLSGRPDYLVKARRHLIPVEVKSAAAPSEPYHAHILQLIAYCILVEQAYGQRPPYGLLRYADRTFRVPNRAQVRREVVDLLEEMREELDQSEAPAGTEDARRCRRCGFADVCRDYT